ncbi:hypothetical protein EDD52_1107 [Primorskyibacter sedentarius]|uniref:Uncharacterized protein n=1 Tax=Primorskyibacter sedentarius TaxID=745311 RepID=A0A4R3J8L7_9RHOB|nr:hypothetical protein [Primorskyibacter sedentarius]TCS61834.1 hypothetical protein EDD52_1107 [Primorskyibacter sedentarius]
MVLNDPYGDIGYNAASSMPDVRTDAASAKCEKRTTEKSRVLPVRALRSERLRFPKLPLLNRAAKEEGEPILTNAAVCFNGRFAGSRIVHSTIVRSDMDLPVAVLR